MATVVNLPPDPSFGSGRAGVAIGKFLTAVVEGRRKKEIDDEITHAERKGWVNVCLDRSFTLWPPYPGAG